MKKHILNVRKQSRIKLPKNNLWFFSEENASNQLSESEEKFSRKDRASIINDDYKRSTENQEMSTTKKQCSFVVDWQMQDTF